MAARQETLELLEEEEEQEEGTLHRELDALTEENQALKAEVSSLGQQLSDAKLRFCERWHTNCKCLAECDYGQGVRD